jgi:hypothetical protein
LLDETGKIANDIANMSENELSRDAEALRKRGVRVTSPTVLGTNPALGTI